MLKVYQKVIYSKKTNNTYSWEIFICGPVLSRKLFLKSKDKNNI